MEVYIVQNLVNGKIYIGKTKFTCLERWEAHCYDASRDVDFRLHRAIRKYGRDNFAVYTLTATSCEAELDALERVYIQLFSSNCEEVGYNMTGGGDGVLNMDPLSKERMRAKLHLCRWTSSRREKFRLLMQGRKVTWGGKISKGKIGVPVLS